MGLRAASMLPSTLATRRFARFGWSLVTYDVAVVAWGAYVRATGSGPGCGSHWPTCPGEIVPRAPALKTLVELSHRIPSGLAAIAVLVLALWAWRAFPKGHPVRKGAMASLLFIAGEVAIGAGLVLFELVAQNASMKRALSGSLHLVNTFFLLGSLALTAWWASGGASLGLRSAGGWQGDQGLLAGVFAVGLLGVVLVGASGAVTALGDTLFPSRSLAEGLQQDFSSASHFLIQLRVIHPILAILVGIYSILAGLLAAAPRPSQTTRWFARALIAIFVAQLIVGVVNVALLAPIAIQIMHLLLADLVWLTLLLAAAATLADRAPERATVPLAESALRAGHS